jgi:hypothetical protein
VRAAPAQSLSFLSLLGFLSLSESWYICKKDMATPLKDLYSPAFYAGFCQVLKNILPAFGEKEFLGRIFTPAFPDYELKERMAHSARVLRHFMPADFDQAAPILIRIVDELWKAGLEKQSLEYMLLPEYVAMYGLDDFESSMTAMETITRFSSCEFAVRPFIIRYPERMLGRMLSWSKHPDERVRRLASEGSRPRLPWAIALHQRAGIDAKRGDRHYQETPFPDYHHKEILYWGAPTVGHRQRQGA